MISIAVLSQSEKQSAIGRPCNMIARISTGSRLAWLNGRSLTGSGPLDLFQHVRAMLRLLALPALPSWHHGCLTPIYLSTEGQLPILTPPYLQDSTTTLGESFLLYNRGTYNFLYIVKPVLWVFAPGTDAKIPQLYHQVLRRESQIHHRRYAKVCTISKEMALIGFILI